MKQFTKNLHSSVWLRVWALAILAFLGLTSGASAHALLTKSVPDDGAILEQAPKQVTASFSEELDSGLSTVRVFNDNGKQVDNGDGGVDLHDPDHTSMLVTLPVSLPEGTFVVRWTAVSAEDGDPTEGQFFFGVGEVPEAGQFIPSKEAQSHDDDNEFPLMWLTASIVVLLVTVGIVILTARSNRKTEDGI